METIDIDRINPTDTRFCISFPLEDPLLLDSIRIFGIRMPLLLLDSTPYTIVTGFKRVEAARLLGLRTVPCEITDMAEKDALLAAISDNIRRPLNIVERALALEKMCGFDFAMEETYAMMKLLGFEPHEKLLKTLLEIARTETATKEFVIRYGASITHVEILLTFDHAERTQIVDLLSNFRLTFSQLREVLQAFLLIKARGEQIVFEEYSRCMTADELRFSLKKKTHPILSSLEKRLKEIRAAIDLPPSVTLKVDPFFEKESIEIGIKAQAIEEVATAIRTLDGIVRNSYLRSIFELTKGARTN